MAEGTNEPQPGGEPPTNEQPLPDQDPSQAAGGPDRAAGPGDPAREQAGEALGEAAVGEQAEQPGQSGGQTQPESDAAQEQRNVEAILRTLSGLDREHLGDFIQQALAVHVAQHGRLNPKDPMVATLLGLMRQSAENQPAPPGASRPERRDPKTLLPRKEAAARLGDVAARSPGHFAVTFQFLAPAFTEAERGAIAQSKLEDWQPGGSMFQYFGLTAPPPTQPGAAGSPPPLGDPDRRRGRAAPAGPQRRQPGGLNTGSGIPQSGDIPYLTPGRASPDPGGWRTVNGDPLPERMRTRLRTMAAMVRGGRLTLEEFQDQVGKLGPKIHEDDRADFLLQTPDDLDDPAAPDPAQSQVPIGGPVPGSTRDRLRIQREPRRRARRLEQIVRLAPPQPEPPDEPTPAGEPFDPNDIDDTYVLDGRPEPSEPPRTDWSARPPVRPDGTDDYDSSPTTGEFSVVDPDNLTTAGGPLELNPDDEPWVLDPFATWVWRMEDPGVSWGRVRDGLVALAEQVNSPSSEEEFNNQLNAAAELLEEDQREQLRRLTYLDFLRSPPRWEPYNYDDDDR